MEKWRDGEMERGELFLNFSILNSQRYFYCLVTNLVLFVCPRFEHFQRLIV
jgi:hypothetical protein